MMILRSAAPSPFGRKVQIALSVLGFDDVKVEPTDTMDPRDAVREQNPLGKNSSTDRRRRHLLLRLRA